MRNFEALRRGFIALLVCLAAFPTAWLRAGEEEATSPGQEVGVGKFFKLPFHVSVSVRGGYDDNVLLNSFDRQGSTFINGTAVINYVFGNPRTQMNLSSTIGFTQYLEKVQNVEYDFNPNLTFSITHRASARLTLALTTYLTYQQQPDFTNFIGSTNRRNGNFFYTSDKFSVSYTWKPRFSTVTSYTLSGIRYDDSATGQFEDRTEHYIGNEFRFLLLPTTTLIGEVRFAVIAYETDSPFSRNSTSQYLLGGIDHNFSPRFSISARGGIEFREYENFDSQVDPYFEGTLIYAVGPHLSLTWTNRYGLEEADIRIAPNRTTFRTAVAARYNITARITWTLNLYWQHDDNEGLIAPGVFNPSFTEDIFSASIALRYALNRNWGMELGYEYVNDASDLAFREYYRSRFYGGANFQF